MGYNSFYTGLSGLKAQSASIGVIGNNLANVNTVGFKGSRTSFAELFSSSGLGGFNGGFGLNGAGATNQVGLGVAMSGVQQLFQQGALQPTEVVTDMAIQGGGFFTLKTPDGLSVYTRAGDFSFDKEGFLVNPNGYRVQGYTGKDASGNIQPSGTTSDIQVPTGLTAPPNLTTYLQTYINLNAGARVDDPSTAADESETFTTGMSVFDSLGEEHELSVVFTPVDTDADGVLEQWAWEARVPAADVGAAAPPDYVNVGTGTFAFDANGQLTSAANQTLNIAGWANGAAAQAIEWRVLDASGASTITGFAAPSSLDSLSQDGYGVGRLRSLTVDDYGLISGVFTNGETLQLAQLALADFNNPGGLLKYAGNSYFASTGSGPAALGAANTGGRGSITPRALELSNVDVTDQFTALIVAERGYQANTRVIQSTDLMTQEALRIKS